MDDVDIDAYYRRYAPMVFRRCRRLLRNDARARDAMQEVFVKLLQHRDRLEPNAPSSLLYRMATNECLNRLRDEGRRPETSGDDLLLRIAGRDDHEARSAARSLLDRLFRPERESTQLIAVLHLVDGMTLEEVAAEVNLSVSAVRKRLRKLRARVKELEGV